MTAYECIMRARSNRVSVDTLGSAYSLIMTYKHKIWPDYSEQTAEMDELDKSLSFYGFMDENGRLGDYTLEQAISIIKTADDNVQ